MHNMRIGDLVSMDASGDFRSDVQLSDFDNPTLNRELLNNYIFTVQAPVTYGAQQRSLSAHDVLEQLKTIFTVERAENRIVLTANYGHGKSHLALVLANFFSRPSESPEVQIILDRLNHALDKPSKLAGHRDFKQSKGEFLVVRLQGDVFNDLQEGFVRALEKALREHDSTRFLALPFWYERAEDWLNGLNGEMLQKAEAFLADQNTDLPSLKANLRRQESYQLVRELFKYVTGMYPDFGGDVSLKEMVLWAVDEVCIPHKLGGLLVLFDEFGLFLQKYIAARTVGKLQELLNGISERAGKSAFLAFSQQDVDTLAETYAEGQRREDVKKELERLPKDRRARLYSLMEAVLASYLKQDRGKWQACFGEPAKKGYLVQARNITLTHFSKRYEDIRWDKPEVFQEKVVEGCFPLHPLTTAILAAHNFESGAAENPRTALQFVRRTWQEVRDQPVHLPNGKPNFVYPVALVDFFEGQISKKWYDAYRNAIETAPTALSPEQQKILQALLLQHATGLKASGRDQIELLHHLSGLDSEEIRTNLKKLSEQKVIRFDPAQKVSSLWPFGTRPQEVEEIIQKAIERIPIDPALMDLITQQLSPMEVSSLNFGHATDWAPQQVALTAEMFTVERLRQLAQPYRLGVNGIDEGPRGLVIWLVANTEEEKIRLRQGAQSILGEVLKDVASPLPIVIVLPKRPVAGLVTAARRLRALQSLTTTEREKIGSVIFNEEINQARYKFDYLLRELVDDPEHYADIPRSIDDYAVPNVYRASIQALKNLSLKSVITECYRLAYAYRVEFYTQYAVGGKGPNKLREAVREVVHWLLGNTAGNSIPNSSTKDIKYQLATEYLTKKWGLLSASSYAIQCPTQRALHEAWDLLEKAFPPGCSETRVRDVLLTLLNPPYGHDYNTLVLLLSAWIGYHQHEIRLSLGGRLISINELRKFFDESKSPQVFLNRLCLDYPLTILRVKLDEIFGEVNKLLEDVRRDDSRFTIAQAEEARAKLQQAKDHPDLPDTIRAEIQQWLPRLAGSLKMAQEYDRLAETWIDKLHTASQLNELLTIHKNLRSFPNPSLVVPSRPSLEELRARWEEKFQPALKKFCEEHAGLDDLTKYTAYKDRLNNARKELEQFPHYAQQIDEALRRLDQARAELEKRESEKTIIAEINSMTSSAALRDLYKFRDKLQALTDLSQETARLRDEKLSKIVARIQRYEQIAVELPAAVDRASQLSDVRQQKDLLLRNLEQLEGTSLHQPLLELQTKLEYLGAFFERLKGLHDRIFSPQITPRELDAIEAQLDALEMDFAPWLAPSQKAVLKTTKDQLESLRQRKAKEARDWLNTLEQRYKHGDLPGNLLRQIETPPAFLDSDDLARLAKLKDELQRRMNDDIVWQIENLFRSITDVEVRRQCLKRLQELVDA